MPTATAKRRKPAKGHGRGAHAVVDFINDLHHTGDFHGVPFALRPWQEAIVRDIFAPDGKAKYRKVFIGLPRKQGKTELIAAVVNYLMFGTGKKSQKIYSASGDTEQAALVYGAAAEMIRQSESLSAHALCYDGYKEIRFEPLGSKYKALSSDAPRKHGLRPSVVILDELHVFPNRDLYKALMTAFGATIEPLTIMITTAGHDRTSLCWEQWQYARGVRDGLIDDPEFLPILWETDPEDDWTSEATWHKAMPALGDFCQLDFIRSEFRNARNLPAYENTFRQLYLNQWTEQASRWIQVERWKRCGGAFDMATLHGRPCYAGLDLGITGDMACYAMVFPPYEDDKYHRVFVHGWVPKDGRWRQELRNRDRYLEFERRGDLTFTEGEALDPEKIPEQSIIEWAEAFPLRMLFADRAYANSLLNRLANNAGLPVKAVPQSPVALNEAMVRLEHMILNEEIRHGDNPILNWNVANASVYTTTAGLKKLDKSSLTERIDGLAAMLNALAAMIADPVDNGPSVYESRGLLTV